jgi:hypothetical protein
VIPSAPIALPGRAVPIRILCYPAPGSALPETGVTGGRGPDSKLAPIRGGREIKPPTVAPCLGAAPSLPARPARSPRSRPGAIQAHPERQERDAPEAGKAPVGETTAG